MFTYSFLRFYAYSNALLNGKRPTTPFVRTTQKRTPLTEKCVSFVIYLFTQPLKGNGNEEIYHKQRCYNQKHNVQIPNGFYSFFALVQRIFYPFRCVTAKRNQYVGDRIPTCHSGAVGDRIPTCHSGA